MKGGNYSHMNQHIKNIIRNFQLNTKMSKKLIDQVGKYMSVPL